MDWIYSADDPIVPTLIGSMLMFIVVILVTKIIGLRSFAKFSSFDFAFTIAIGSIISSTLTSSTSIAQGATAIFSLLFLTAVFAFLQRKFKAVDKVINNTPLLLMDGKKILENNLNAANVSRSQLIAKLREANVIRLEQVKAVVLESTGDISVLHTSDAEDTKLADIILTGVRKTP